MVKVVDKTHVNAMVKAIQECATRTNVALEVEKHDDAGTIKITRNGQHIFSALQKNRKLWICRFDERLFA